MGQPPIARAEPKNIAKKRIAAAYNDPFEHSVAREFPRHAHVKSSLALQDRTSYATFKIVSLIMNDVSKLPTVAAVAVPVAGLISKNIGAVTTGINARP